MPDRKILELLKGGVSVGFNPRGSNQQTYLDVIHLIEPPATSSFKNSGLSYHTYPTHMLPKIGLKKSIKRGCSDQRTFHIALLLLKQ